MSNYRYKKVIVVGISILFIGVGLFPCICGDYNKNQESIKLTFYSFDRTGSKKCNAEIPKNIAKKIFDRFEELRRKITIDPNSAETQAFKNEFVEMLDTNKLIPKGLSKEDLISILNPNWQFHKKNNISPGPFAHTGSSFFCSMAGGGSGVLFSPIMMPRPRFVTVWSAYLDDAISIASNLYTGHGFAAYGSQLGMALGFWGIGLSFAVPGEPAFFGFGGYALAAFVGAEEVENYPPNQIPEISEENPSDGSVDVPTFLSELSFRISDGDGDHMSYSVTTDPDIGSGDGSNVVGGVYSIPVSGLNSDTEYSWHVVVSDAEDINEETFSFRTAKESPFVSDPNPVDGDDWVSVNISELSFRLEDFQGDLMDFTVETVPDIGSGSGSGVGDGVYTVSVSNLEYTRDYSWFVNVTDGEYWTRRVFNFKTQPIMVFDPFNWGWLYRKKITINHDMVAGNLENFPLLISLTDLDLLDKAQDDGDDILFMDGSGVANRLLHEIEFFDGSSGELVVWVNVPSLSSVDDTVLYMYYGNPGCSNQQYPERVWNSNYCAVWHLNEDPSQGIYDSTSNNNDGISHGIMNSENLVDGKIGKCIEFDGDNDYISVSDSISLKPESVSLQTFFKPLENNPESGFFLVKSSYDIWGNADGRNYGFNWSNEKNLIGGRFERNSKPQSETLGSYPTNIDSWYTLVLTFDKSSRSGAFYVNGLKIDSGDNYHESVLWYNKPWDFVMGGSRAHEGSSKKINQWFKCCLDEVRVISKSLDSDWITTEYKNQNDPLSFYIIGPEESGP